MPSQLELLEAVTKSAGLACGVLALMCLIVLRLHAAERKDRREAWKAHNELAKETNKIIRDITMVLEGIKQHVLGGNK